MKEVNGETRQIHQQVIADIGLETALGLLRIARELRDGTIPANMFDMNHINDLKVAIYENGKQKRRKDGGLLYEPACGTPCCIIGWLRINTNDNYILDRWADEDKWGNSAPRLHKLFMSCHPSVPNLGAQAIERYLYDYAELPWGRL